MTVTTAAPARSSRQAAPRRKATPTTAQQCVGIVTRADADRFVISSGGLTAQARRAASCLLEPAAGDSVACLIVAPDEYWILAVLTREEGMENRLRCVGPTRLEVSGPMKLEAERLDLHGDTIGVRSKMLDIATDEAVAVGRQFRLVGNSLKLVGALLSTVFDRVSHFSKHHQRTTEGIDRVQAQYLEQDARQILRLSGQTTLITGETVVKARGGQVHLG